MAENGDHRNVISAPRQRQGSAEHNLRTNSCCHNTSLATVELVMCCHVSKCFHPWLFDGAVEAAWLTWFKCAMHKSLQTFLSSTYIVQERILYILCIPVDTLMSTSGWDSGSLNVWQVTVLRPVEKPDTSRSPLNVWSWYSIQRVIQCVIQTAEGVQQNMEEHAGNYAHSGLHRPKSVAFLLITLMVR